VRDLALYGDEHLYFVANNSVNEMNLKSGAVTKYVGKEGRWESRATESSLSTLPSVKSQESHWIGVAIYM
jgi:hypothetical protein